MNRIIISDILTGKHTWGDYKLYNKTQWYSEKELEDFQLKKLQKLLNHCNENVKYYQNIIAKKKIKIAEIDSLRVLEEFPILTKEIIQDNYKDFTPKNIRKISGVKTSQTGGTTGNILLKRNDTHTRSSIWGSFKRFEDWMGVKENDHTLILMGGHIQKTGIKERIKPIVTNLLKNSYSVDIYDTSEETIEHIIRLLQTNKFKHIRSYPQFLFSIAITLKKRGLSFNFNSITTTAEPVMPEHRELFAKVFNAEVYDQYGCGEIGGIAYECNHHKGLHVSGERVVLEVNQSHELIITDLDNYAMPFIRYWNADQAILKKEKCSCGREGLLLEKVMGRTCDYLISSDGRQLHWAFFLAFIV